MLADYTLDDIEEARHIDRGVAVSPKTHNDYWSLRLLSDWGIICVTNDARRVYRQRLIIGNTSDLLGSARQRGFLELAKVVAADEASRKYSDEEDSRL